MPNFADSPDDLLLKGGSAIIGPNGRYIVEPVFEEETILSTAVDFSEIDKERMALDVSATTIAPICFD